MKAAQIDNYGDSTNIEVRETERPVINNDQVLVEVRAASLNPFDLMVLSGNAQAMAPLNFPATLGLDIAGTVAEIGADVTGFAVGDRVYGTANAMFGASGAFAEFVAANASSLAPAPVNISDAEAASLPTAGISAWQSIVKELNVQKGQKVFVNGGAGGVGSIAVQIAKHLGAYVAATASDKNIEFVKSLGADEVIDYTQRNFAEVISNYDAALNTVHHKSVDDILQILKEGGTVASLTGQLDEAKAVERSITNIAVMAKVSTESLSALKEIVEQDGVKPMVAKTFTLEHIREAYESLANDSIQGKIVIQIS